MDITELYEQFYELVAPSMPAEEDVERSLQPLVGENNDTTIKILQQVPALWSVSYTLCFSYLAHVRQVVPYITRENLDRWVKELLEQYNSQGLSAVLRRIEQAHSFQPRLRGKKGVLFDDVQGRLQLYLNGLAGKEIPIIAAGTTYTDTQSIFVPWELDALDTREDIIFLYKSMVTYQWASLRLGTVSIRGFGRTADTAIHPLQDFFTTGADPLLLMQLYHFFEMVRTLSYLRRELPGLMNGFDRITPQLCCHLSLAENQTDLIHYLQWCLLGGKVFHDHQSPLLQSVAYWVEQCEQQQALRSTSQRAASDVAARLTDDLFTSYEAEPLVFQGELRLHEVMTATKQRRARRQQQFIETFSSYLADSPSFDLTGESLGEQDACNLLSSDDQDSAISGEDTDQQSMGKQTTIMVGDQQIPLNEELAELADDIAEDLGQIPVHYLNCAVEAAEQARSLAGTLSEGALPRPARVQFTYDEWDCRRRGFRREWCVVTEKSIPRGASSFAQETLTHYRHQVAILKRQFEMLQTTTRYVYRQKEGDDIDIDAVMESIADTRAGYTPSDNLFVRLVPNQRDIAVLFLVDMSSSTEGWVGRAIKEALLLICESLAMLKDRYGIYGFSGRCRLGCEIFPIKTLDEPYGNEVKERIAGISPQDYTRMGPAIRHMTALFQQVDARLRLLVILSDGQPKDYDEYREEYAIEDTRHALIEAKFAGVQPFCITIDDQVQPYMRYMYGPANYIIVDDLKKLPLRMPEVYRTLTT